MAVTELQATKEHEKISELQTHLNQCILGQENLINRLLIALLADGHLLVEGAPGLAKTRAVKVLADAIDAGFHRIQFTPDLLPGDLTGTDIYRPETGEFVFQQGPLFHPIILADEINRSPAKVQSALLEAMAERQITIGRHTYSLPKLFMVMATQNPLEQEGTYPLPEAQRDRFLMYVKIGYPDEQKEKAILALARKEAHEPPAYFEPISEDIFFAARNQVLAVYLSEALENYLIDLVLATRKPEKYSVELAEKLRYGVSPRATIGLDRAAKAHAWLKGRNHVIPEDIHEVVHDIFRHRLILTFEAEAEGVSSDDVIDELLKRVAIP